MRIYVHHEPESAPEFTLAIEWPATSAALAYDLGAHFAAAYTAAHPTKPLSAGEVKLMDADGGGAIRFDEFCAWVRRRKIPVD